MQLADVWGFVPVHLARRVAGSSEGVSGRSCLVGETWGEGVGQEGEG